MTRKMKDSGVEWIGEIPEDWEVVKNKYLFKSKKNVVGNEFKAFNLLSLTKRKGIIYRDIENMEGKLPESFTTYQSVEKDDLVLCLFDLDISAVFSDVSKFDGMISSAYNNFEIKNDYPMFYKYWFDMINDGRKYKIYSKSLRYTIDIDNFNSLLSVKPPISKQKSIADFLDEKTQEIDNIISKTKKAIEEYKKYKQSLITETVTKGLDENVQMKDSGIEWIGEIPENWDIIRPNRVCKILRGNSSFQKTDLESKGDYIALQYGRTYKVDIVDDSYRHYVDRSFYKSDQIVENGDTVLISTSETMEDLGHSCFYNRDDIGLLGGEQMCLKPNKDNVQGKFLYYATKYFHIELNQYATGLKVYRFRLDDLKKINMVLPPKDEQYKIISFLDEKLPLIDQIISTKEKLLIEMEAYKKSLIYETVTGKREVE